MTVSIVTSLALSGAPLDGPAAVSNWADISEYVHEIHPKRGRQSERTFTETGTLILGLDDSEGHFNAENEASPFYPYADVGGVVKVEIAANGTVYPVCVMYADDCPPTSAAKVAVTSWSLADGSVLLAGANFPTAQTYPAETTGAAVGHCLDALGWAGPRSIAAGTVQVQVVVAGDLDGVALSGRIQTLCEIENGTFFWAADGTPTFLDQDSRLALSSDVTFSDDYLGDEIGYLPPTLSRARSLIENDWRIQVVGESERSALDAASRDKYGPMTQHKTLPFFNADDATAACQHRVAERMLPQTRLSALACPLVGDTAWATCLALEIGDAVLLKRTPGGGSQRTDLMLLEGPSLDIIGASGTFTAVLSPAEAASYWLLEDDNFGLLEETTFLW
jgi:hypothetical protein